MVLRNIVAEATRCRARSGRCACGEPSRSCRRLRARIVRRGRGPPAAGGPRRQHRSPPTAAATSSLRPFWPRSRSSRDAPRRTASATEDVVAAWRGRGVARRPPARRHSWSAAPSDGRSSTGRSLGTRVARRRRRLVGGGARRTRPSLRLWVITWPWRPRLLAMTDGAIVPRSRGATRTRRSPGPLSRVPHVARRARRGTGRWLPYRHGWRAAGSGGDGARLPARRGGDTGEDLLVGTGNVLIAGWLGGLVSRRGRDASRAA